MKTDFHVNANYQGKEHGNAYENRTTGLGKMYEPDAEQKVRLKYGQNN